MPQGTKERNRVASFTREQDRRVYAKEEVLDERTTSLLNSRQLKFCLSAVGIFGFLTFEPSCEALNDRSEDEVRHTD